MLEGIGKAYRRAKKFRRELSLPEVLLWQQLRRNQTGFHWRKQHPAGPYDLDFYREQAKPCVEVDDEGHERGDRPRKDAVRDAFLERHGILTLRIRAVDVLKNLGGVVVHVVEHARNRTAALGDLRSTRSSKFADLAEQNFKN